MILVIEDDLNLRDTICDILQASGREVAAAANGWDGLQIANNQTIDLVICDVNMPIMDGLETIRRFRRSKKNALVPFFFLSAYSTMKDLRAGMDLGADDYLSKPFNGNELLDTVKRLLDKYSDVKECYKTKLNERIAEVLNNSNDVFTYKKQRFLDSLEHARLVQSAVLTDRNQLNDVVSDFGLFHRPKEVVSGDFYWVKKLNGKCLIAVGDCTGHGYPAALMTMVCSNALSIAVDLLGMKRPKDILVKSNELIIDFMTSKDSLANHGMDIVMCLVDYDKNEISFASAKRPFYYLSDQLIIDPNPHEDLSIQNAKDESVYRIRGGCYSIGDENFSTDLIEYTLQCRKGDLIYLSTDGYFDQMGGSTNKKFMTSRFMRLIHDIKDQPLLEQEQALDKAFMEWKGNAEQTDDVTVLIVKF